MGEIPVLEEDGERLTQTAPILLRLAERHGRLQGIGERQRFEMLRWLFWDNHKLSSFMATYRFRRAFLPPGDTAVMTYLKGRVDDCLGVLEQHVASQPFAAGDQPTVADISMCGYLSFPTKRIRLRSGRQPPGNPRLAAAHRDTARLASAL